MDANIFRPDGLLKFIMGSTESVRIMHGFDFRKWEHIEVAMLSCSVVSSSTACRGNTNVCTKFCAFGGLTTDLPLMQSLIS